MNQTNFPQTQKSKEEILAQFKQRVMQHLSNHENQQNAKINSQRDNSQGRAGSVGHDIDDNYGGRQYHNTVSDVKSYFEVHPNIDVVDQYDANNPSVSSASSVRGLSQPFFQRNRQHKKGLKANYLQILKNSVENQKRGRQVVTPVGKDCDANLWNMIDTFKKESGDKTQKKVVKQAKKVS